MMLRIKCMILTTTCLPSLAAAAAVMTAVAAMTTATAATTTAVLAAIPGPAPGMAVTATLPLGALTAASKMLL